MPTVDKKSKLILAVSETMTGRDEHKLVRMSSSARKNMKFGDFVEVSDNLSMALEVKKAYLADLRAIRVSGDYSAEELVRVGFVSRQTFEKVTAKPAPPKPKPATEPLEEITMGADPEFLLYDANGNVVYANNVMPKAGKLGSDGAMAEIRPDPTTSTDQLIENISAIFNNKTLTDKISLYKWMAGCYYKDNHRDYPLGGHIHVGNAGKIKKIADSSRYVFFAIINKILDELLAIPLSKLDGKEPGSCRRTKCGMVFGGGSGYGYFGEWRECQGRLEHRTLSGMWLTHPTLAKATFGVARAIVEEAYRRMHDKDYDLSYVFPLDERTALRPKQRAWQSEYDGWKEVPILVDMHCIRSSNEMNSLLNSCDPHRTGASFLRKWLEVMKSFSTFKKHEQHIRALLEILKAPVGEIQSFEKQIQKNWIEKTKFITD